MDCTRFGNKLNYYRERNDMTEKDLARKLHVPVRMIEKWENSEAVPNDRVIQKLSDLFGVDFWNYLDMDEKHGGRHITDDEPDRSPFEVLKTAMAGKARQVSHKKTSSQAWQGWQSKDFGQVGQTGQANRDRSTSYGSPDSDLIRKIISKILMILSSILIICGVFVFEDIFGIYGADVMVLPVALLLAIVSIIIGKKK